MKTNSWDGSESRPYRDVIGRRALPHDPPLFVDASKEIFFITICCKKRGANQLCYPEVASTSIPGDAILPTPAEMVCSRSSFDAGPCSFPRQLLD